jgi:hypothetical protein
MGTITAQIIVGMPHGEHGGIGPEYVVWLSEDGDPAWVLQPVPPDHWGGPPYLSRNVGDSTVWMPSAPGHILEDGILLIAVHALRDETVLDLVEERLPELAEARAPFQDSPVDLTAMPPDVLAELRRQSMEPTWEDLKLAVTVLSGSALHEQLPILERYPMQVEVCAVSYARLKRLGRASDDDVHVGGSLEAIGIEPGEINEMTSVEAVEGYCVKERKLVVIKGPVELMMADGRTTIQGVCPDCGTAVFKVPHASSAARTLSEGTFLRWIDQEPGQKPLGIVLSPPTNADEDIVYVLMADQKGNTDVEVFVAREEDTGFDASNLVQQSMEIVEDGDPEVMGLLSTLGPNWWHISAHLAGEHADRGDPECLLCQGGDDAAEPGGTGGWQDL